MGMLWAAQQHKTDLLWHITGKAKQLSQQQIGKEGRKKNAISNLSVPELKVVFIETVLANSTSKLLLRGENQRKKMVTYLYITYMNCTYNTEVL